ncbi:MAG: YciI family protein, partial [Promethearchaeota archaeon]
DLLDDSNWTEIENKIVEEHFQRLKLDCEKGKVILAGRTLTNTPEGFGIVIFRDISIKNAEIYMNNDPAIQKKIMTGTLFPYRNAMINADK